MKDRYVALNEINCRKIEKMQRKFDLIELMLERHHRMFESIQDFHWSQIAEAFDRALELYRELTEDNLKGE